MRRIRDAKRKKPETAAKSKEKERIKSRMQKGSVYCLLLVLVLLNIVYRYPLEVTRELGADTTFIHSLAGSIANQGAATWVLNPASLFGFYALSYPSGVPFLLAGFSELSSMSVEGGILVLGMVLGIIGCLSAFLASREIFRNDFFSFLVALLFSLAPFFLRDTTWVGSSRGSVVAFIPILLWLQIRAIRMRDSRYFVLSIFVFILVCSLHRMGLLTFFFFIAFFFISSIHKITQRIRFALVRYEGIFRTSSTIMVLSTFFLMFYIQILFPGYGGFDIVRVYGRGALFEGTDFVTLLLNMAVNFIGKVGIIVPVSLLGLLAYAWKRPKEIQEKFVLVVVFLLVPFISLRDYISEFMILFFVLLGVFFLIYLQTRWGHRKRVFAVAVVSLLVLSLGFSWVMKDYWRNKYTSDTPISESTFDTSMYLKGDGVGIILSNYGLMAGRISALTEGPVLPLGGASTHWYGPQQLTFRTSESPNLLFFDVDQLTVRRLNYDEITFSTDEVFVPTNAPNVFDDWVQILLNDPTDAKVTGISDKYDIHYVVIHKARPFNFYTYGWKNSIFLRQIQEDASQARFKIFENTEETVWFYR